MASRHPDSRPVDCSRLDQPVSPRELFNKFFFNHPEDPTQEEIDENQRRAYVNGWDKLKYSDPEDLLLK